MTMFLVFLIVVSLTILFTVFVNYRFKNFSLKEFEEDIKFILFYSRLLFWIAVLLLIINLCIHENINLYYCIMLIAYLPVILILPYIGLFKLLPNNVKYRQDMIDTNNNLYFIFNFYPCVSIVAGFFAINNIDVLHNFVYVILITILHWIEFNYNPISTITLQLNEVKK